MSGTKIGGQRAAKTNIKLYGKDFYRTIGSKGGQNGHTGGFAANPALARVAGAQGGRISRRIGKTTGDRKEKEFFWNGDLMKKLSFRKDKE